MRFCWIVNLKGSSLFSRGYLKVSTHQNVFSLTWNKVRNEIKTSLWKKYILELFFLNSEEKNVSNLNNFSLSSISKKKKNSLFLKNYLISWLRWLLLLWYINSKKEILSDIHLNINWILLFIYTPSLKIHELPT